MNVENNNETIDIETKGKIQINKKEFAKGAALVGAGIAAGAVITSAYLGHVHAAELAIANQGMWSRFTGAISRVF